MLAAFARADAAVGRESEAAVVLGKRKVRFGLPRLVVHAPAQVFVELVRVRDLPRIHFVLGIPNLLELPERLHELVAVHDGEQLAARLTVAVLARKRTAESYDQMRRLGDELAVFPDAARGEKIEVDTAVQTSLSKVAVEGGLVSVLVHELLKLAQVLAEALGIYRGVFPTGIKIRFVRNFRGRAEPRFAHFPQAQLLRLVVENLRRGRMLLAPKRVDQFVRIRVGFLFALASELDDEPRVSVGKHRAA